MSTLRILAVVALSSLISAAAWAESSPISDDASNAPTHRACLRNPSFAFCQVATTDGKDSQSSQGTDARTHTVPAGQPQ
jgi:hypothetical protein